MQKCLWAICLLLTFFSILPTAGQAAGGITHMYLAIRAIPLLPDKRLQDLLQGHMDAYLTGSNYPDTGYITGTHYGEDSHWEPFLNAFTDFIREQYTNPADQNPDLVAFLLGCATHSVSDRIFHAEFVTREANEDFHGNWSAAHEATDAGMDYIINMEKRQWLVRPGTWWVPVEALEKVYQKMGKPWSAGEIRWGNSVYSAAGIGERFADPVVYNIYRYSVIPWAAKNYEQASEGGMERLALEIAPFVTDIWKRIVG